MAPLMLDTHVVAWLYGGRLEKLPDRAKARLETDALTISPMVVLELQYLHEIGRLNTGSQEVIEDLKNRIGLRVSNTSLERLARTAVSLSWTRDPFDRLIAAQSLVEQVPLLTADHILRENLPLAFWG